MDNLHQRFVRSRTAGQAAVARIVSGNVSRSIAPRRGAVQQLFLHELAVQLERHPVQNWSRSAKGPTKTWRHEAAFGAATTRYGHHIRAVAISASVAVGLGFGREAVLLLRSRGLRLRLNAQIQRLLVLVFGGAFGAQIDGTRRFPGYRR